MVASLTFLGTTLVHMFTDAYNRHQGQSDS
uniref:Uncharacterized protein n=1 Tax=Anguilla anguilla TaxID=7936 RepID=A0A0E9PZC4_ANGAN